MRILITGGSGFIGKNLCEYLQEKNDLIVPTHDELDLLDDTTVQVYLRNNPVDVIIHAAGKPGHRNAKRHAAYRDCR